ncbi:hypothetical protein PAXINDRAFT_20427 [Paxillus involutus ATCC 200175]|uniref:Uncharacterized protein n=1 Tax=Paxillus involutus ATCC 200175 TaxID=664439 RepID=A0A0C9SML4_PAXIN|nr:hypothetical protein PAXINDRAFT_20427 [Paxillus involutus ATCC 200175]
MSHSKLGNGEHATDGQQDAWKEVDYNHVPLDRVAFITEPVVGFKSFGISFTANCMRGRSTTVFWVEDVVGNEPRYLGEQNGTLQRSPKNNDPHQNIELGLQQVQCYARDIRRAQHFLVALTVTRNELALLRGERSGTECLELALLDGRGCIELFRILLGRALAEGDDLGQNCDVDLATSPATTAPRVQVSYCECKATASSSQPHFAPAFLSTHDTSQPVLSSSGLAPHISDGSVPSSAAVSSNSERSYCEVDDGDDAGEDERKPSKKANKTEVPVVAFIPVAVYGHKCLGILFTTSSIRGRGTAVFCVVDVKDESRLLALKITSSFAFYAVLTH